MYPWNCSFLRNWAPVPPLPGILPIWISLPPSDVFAILPVKTEIPFTYTVKTLASFLTAMNCQELSAYIVVSVDWRAPPAELIAVALFVTTNSNLPLESS